MTTKTLELHAGLGRHAEPPMPSLADSLARAIHLAQTFGTWLRRPQPTLPEASAQLLRMAALYQETQPSYAADLRAAAGAHDQDGTRLH